jgi:hypothetical protein
MAGNLRVGAVGVDIILPLKDLDGNPINLKLATAMLIYLQPPNATTSSAKVADKIGDGKEGKLIYTTVPGDLAVPGEWKIQARVQYAAPERDWYSEIQPLVVASNLGETTTGTFRRGVA